MTSQPGVVNPYIYESIGDLTVSDGGRHVDVTLTRPLTDWRELFNHLLPSHLYRSGGDFADLMTTSIAASGNRFAMKGVDTARGVITLVRNDRYWGAQTAEIESIVLRTESDSTVIADMLRSGQVEAATLQPKATTELTLNTVPGAVVRTREFPRQLNLVANTVAPRMREPGVRRAILRTIDSNTVAKIVSQRSDATAPTASILDGNVSLQQRFSTTDPLRIAVDQANYAAVNASRIIADQLQNQGIPARVYPLPFSQMVSTVLPAGVVDLAVAWQSTPDDSGALASELSCPNPARGKVDPRAAAVQLSRSQRSRRPRPAGELQHDKKQSSWFDSWGAENRDSVEASPTPLSSAPSTSETPTSETPQPAATPQVAISANLSGYCQPDFDAELQAAAAGLLSFADMQARVANVNAEEGLTLPLLQASEVYAVMPTLLGPRTDGALPVTVSSGIFASAYQWRRQSAESPRPKDKNNGKDKDKDTE